MANNNDDKISILIVGAGKAGELVAKGIGADRESTYQIMGYIDDDPAKRGKSVAGHKVLGTGADLRDLVADLGVEELLIAIPSERGVAVRQIVERTMGLGLVYKILPRRSEVLLQGFNEDFLKFIRRVRPEDLLGGEIQKSDQQGITKFAHGQTILITGAAGSIGSELSRQIAAHGPKQVVFFDWWENGMFNLRNELIESGVKGHFVFVIGDIKDGKQVNLVIKTFKPTTVFHAAAYKHVPLMEHNPSEAIKNNIVGTKTVAEVAVKHGVKKFILVSSDKAVNPTNIMGATKRGAEMVIHILAESQNTTTFAAVRFGNVVNSNGSVIPTFRNQIEKGGPVTVTHEEVTRYFMTIPEAVHLILQSWVMGQNNDLFVLDMGEPIKIIDLARVLIALDGYVPGQDVKIKIVGLRPGEKLYEEVLVSEEETNATASKKIFRTKNYLNFDKLAFLNHLNLLVESLDDDGLNFEAIRHRMQSMISTYHPAKHKSKV